MLVVIALLAAFVLIPVMIHSFARHYLVGVVISSAICGGSCILLFASMSTLEADPFAGDVLPFLAIYGFFASVVVGIPFWMFRPEKVFPHGTVCLKCGYNLTGNVSGRCPECGRPIGNCAE